MSVKNVKTLFYSKTCMSCQVYVKFPNFSGQLMVQLQELCQRRDCRPTLHGLLQSKLERVATLIEVNAQVFSIQTYLGKESLLHVTQVLLIRPIKRVWQKISNLKHSKMHVVEDKVSLATGFFDYYSIQLRLLNKYPVFG